LRLYRSYPLPVLPYPTSNRLGNKKDAPPTFVPWLLVVPASTDIMVVAAELWWLLLPFPLPLPFPPKKDDADGMLLLWPVLVLPQIDDEEGGQDEEEDDDTDDRDEDEADDALLPAATDMAKGLFLLAVAIAIAVAVAPDESLDAATPNKKSKSSPSPEMGDHWFHSILPVVPATEMVELVFAVSEVCIVSDEEDCLDNCVSV